MAVPLRVTFDCADPEMLATFWVAALGYKPQDPPSGFASWQEFWPNKGALGSVELGERHR